MRKAEVYVHGKKAGILEELKRNETYLFTYDETYTGPPVSLTMPISTKKYEFDSFPPYFEGLLPEGHQLEGLLRHHKINRFDLFHQLMIVGDDMIGAVTVYEIKDDN